MIPDTYDIAIVGAGAAGLAAGIFAAQAASPSPRIVVLEGAKIVGAKILVSGGGRCNVTHDEIRPEDYHGSKNIVRNVLAAFDERAVFHWFASLGVELKREQTGKLFPVTDQARTILDALLGRLAKLGVELQTGRRVTTIVKDEQNDSFVIDHSLGQLRARRLILCTGGKSLPRSGSDGFGYTLAERLGHTITPTYPALVPLVLQESMFHASVSGLSHEAELSTFVSGKRVDQRIGSLLWTHFGISGPVAMDASRFWTMAHAQGQAVELRCNFRPGRSFEDVERQFTDLGQTRPKLTLLKATAHYMPERLAEALLRHLSLDPGCAMGHLSRDDRRRLTHGLTSLVLPVARDRGWNYAEVTAGGIPLSEIDYRTMQSRKISGLFLAGEILDCDGRIGGFNFQWAWASGNLAGRGAVSSLKP